MSDLKTSGIKLSALRACDNCEGILVPQFYVVTAKFALFSPRNVNSVLGTMQILGGALGIAEALAPGADDAVVVSEDANLNVELYLCRHCYADDLNLAIVAEKRSTTIEAARARKTGA